MPASASPVILSSSDVPLTRRIGVVTNLIWNPPGTGISTFVKRDVTLNVQFSL